MVTTYFLCFKTAHTWKGSPTITRRFLFTCLVSVLTLFFRVLGSLGENPCVWSNRTHLRINHKVMTAKRRFESIVDIFNQSERRAGQFGYTVNNYVLNHVLVDCRINCFALTFKKCFRKTTGCDVNSDQVRQHPVEKSRSKSN